MAAAWEISIVSEKPISVELLNLIIKEYEVTDSHNQSIAYSARTAHPFQRNGAPFRFKLSKAQQVD